MKKCPFCEAENSDDLEVCEKCGKSLNEIPKGEIKVGWKTIAVILTILVAIVVFVSLKVFDKFFNNPISMPDPKYNLDVVSYKIPAKWLYSDNIFYNENSLPNLLTFYIAAINPEKNSEFRYFSTQFETVDIDVENDKDFWTPVSPDDFFTNVVKKMSPNAENICIVDIIKPTKKELKDAKEQSAFYSMLYDEINPGTEKGRTWLFNYKITPVHYIFSYKEGGVEYYQMIDAQYTSFLQCFSRYLDANAKVKSVTRFTKCDSMFSYKAPVSVFEKNLGKYKSFKKSLVVNPKWLEQSYAERRKYLSSANYITTETLLGGSKFDQEDLKNLVYSIEYMDKETRATLLSTYKVTWKTYLAKLF